MGGKFWEFVQYINLLPNHWRAWWKAHCLFLCVIQMAAPPAHACKALDLYFTNQLPDLYSITTQSMDLCSITNQLLDLCSITNQLLDLYWITGPLHYKSITRPLLNYYSINGPLLNCLSTTGPLLNYWTSTSQLNSLSSGPACHRHLWGTQLQWLRSKQGPVSAKYATSLTSAEKVAKHHTSSVTVTAASYHH